MYNVHSTVIRTPATIPGGGGGESRLCLQALGPGGGGGGREQSKIAFAKRSARKYVLFRYK
jgi:hypothetical protein